MIKFVVRYYDKRFFVERKSMSCHSYIIFVYKNNINEINQKTILQLEINGLKMDVKFLFLSLTCVTFMTKKI